MSHFLQLPAEIRLRVYTYYLQAIDLHAENNMPALRDDQKPLVMLETYESIGNDADPQYRPPDQVPFYSIRRSPAILHVNKLVHVEITGMQWQSLVRYNFSSTLAMLDVLASMSLEQRELVRRVCVAGTGLILDYRIHELPCCLVLLKGLQLDLLEIVDPYPSDPDDPTDLFVMATIRELLYSNGWKEAHLIAGDFLLRKMHIDELVGMTERLKEDRGEPDFHVQFPYLPIQGDSSMQLMLSSKCGQDCQAPRRPVLNLVVRRGAGAHYLQTSDDFHNVLLERLRDVPSWAQMRTTNYMLKYGERLANL